MHFGTVRSFDETKGYGSIKPEQGGEDLRFERSAIKWGQTPLPQADQRLSYELGTSKDGRPVAVNVNTI